MATTIPMRPKRGPRVRESGPGHTTRVDCYQSGTSSYGVYDLCGNVWEWCSAETEPGRSRP